MRETPFANSPKLTINAFISKYPILFEHLLGFEEKLTRRKALQKLLILPVGAAAAVIGAGGLASVLSRPTFQATSGRHDRQFIDINVRYMGMSNFIEKTSETVRIQSPAKLSNLEGILWKENPALQGMALMQVLINGTGVSGDPDLINGDNVVLIAPLVGG